MKKAIVIGASSGIGKQLAIVLAKNGYDVGIMARRTELLEELKKEIPTTCHIGHIDISKIPDAVDKVRNIIQTMGGVDLFIINSGTGFFNQELDWIKEQNTLDVNVYGFCALAIEMYHFFSKQGHGHLVGISSIAALMGNPQAPAYNASKAFMSNYLEGLRKKAFQEKKSIIVTDIQPGFVDTDLVRGEKLFWVATPEKAAEQIYTAIKHQRSQAYITRRWRFIAWVLKLTPKWLIQRMKW